MKQIKISLTDPKSKFGFLVKCRKPKGEFTTWSDSRNKGFIFPARKLPKNTEVIADKIYHFQIENSLSNDRQGFVVLQGIFNGVFSKVGPQLIFKELEDNFEIIKGIKGKEHGKRI